MAGFLSTCRRFINSNFKALVGPVAEKNGFKFKNYTYYREKNRMLQYFYLRNLSGSYEINFDIVPFCLGAEHEPMSTSLSFFKYTIKTEYTDDYNYGGYSYNSDDVMLSDINDIKNIVEKVLIPYMDSMIDERNVINFYMISSGLNNDFILMLYLKLEEYDIAEELIRSEIKERITYRYNQLNETQEDSFYRRRKQPDPYLYLGFAKWLMKMSDILFHLEQKDYEYIKQMIKKNEEDMAEYLKNPKFVPNW